MALIGDPVFENPESVNAKMTVSYTGLIPITIQMVQELMKENEEIPEADNAARLDADFALMSDAVSALQDRIIAIFGGEAE